MTDPWEAQREALGAFIRAQRKLANLSLRQLADLTRLSNPYLSQVERGLHQPSVRVLKAISEALNVSAETLLTQAGLIDAMVADRQVRRPGPGPARAERPGHRGRHPRRRPPLRRAEGRPDRRLPQHARLTPRPAAVSREPPRRRVGDVPQQQRGGNRPDPAGHRA